MSSTSASPFLLTECRLEPDHLVELGGVLASESTKRARADQLALPGSVEGLPIVPLLLLRLISRMCFTAAAGVFLIDHHLVSMVGHVARIGAMVDRDD